MAIKTWAEWNKPEENPKKRLWSAIQFWVASTLGVITIVTCLVNQWTFGIFPTLLFLMGCLAAGSVQMGFMAKQPDKLTLLQVLFLQTTVGAGMCSNLFAVFSVALEINQ